VVHESEKSGTAHTGQSENWVREAACKYKCKEKRGKAKKKLKGNVETGTGIIVVACCLKMKTKRKTMDFNKFLRPGCFVFANH
jgi:hypothetical protein